MIEVFIPVHMFHMSAEGEDLLTVPFFIIMPGRVMEHIAIDQYSHLHTHTLPQTQRLANLDNAQLDTVEQPHVNADKRAHINMQTHERLCLLAHFPGYEMISIPLMAVLSCLYIRTLYVIGAAG